MVSGQWPVKCDAEEITVIESAEANLLLVLVTGTLRLSTNQAQIELENEPNFRTVLADLHQAIQPGYSARLDRWLLRQLHRYQPDALARPRLPYRK